MFGIEYITFAFFVLSMLFVGIFSAKKVDHERHYLLADRNVGIFALTATLVMTELNTSTLLAFSSFGYAFGWWGISMVSVFLVGLLFYAATVASQWKQYNGLSVACFFSDRYGKDIGYLVNAILLVTMLLFSATYVKSLTLIFLPLFPNIDLWLLSGGLIVLILCMTMKGGLVSIIHTDVYSFLFALVFFPILIWCAIDHVGFENTVITVDQAMNDLPLSLVFSLILMTMFSYILAPWYGQKVIAAKTRKTAVIAVILSAFFVSAFYGIGIWVTSLFQGKEFVMNDSALALPLIMNQVLPLPLKGLGLGLLFSIAATTLAGVWSAMVTLLTGMIQKSRSQENTTTRGMSLTFLCAFCSYLCANIFIDRILDKMIFANIPIVALSFALLGGFYWKSTNRVGVYFSFLAGLIFGLYAYIKHGGQLDYVWDFTVLGIPLIFAMGIMGSHSPKIYSFFRIR